MSSDFSLDIVRRFKLKLFILPRSNVTSYEIAYTRAPARMKGLVYALNLFNTAIAAAISLALSKIIDDPYLIWSYVAVAIACFVAAP